MRWHWGYGIAAVYAAFAAATVGLVGFAMARPVDLVSADYYERAITHDRRQAAIANARRLGPALGTETAADGRTVIVMWPTGQLDVLAGSARLYRPSDAAEDRSWPIAPDADGRQRFSLEGLPAGRWLLQLEWHAGTDEFYVELPVMAR